jgi:23S rRNA (cytidine1920-2'-O)/16S rRNA (cytidine1409-2'-O)-methyltransferase
LDQLLVQRGHAESRSKAAALILAGEVVVGENRVDKPGASVPEDASVRIKASLPFVSRGGVKLAGALDSFQLNVKGSVVLDVGASTGGFTDCLLQRGATKSYAVDVGRGQLHERIRTDPRVVVMEEINARGMKTADLPEKVDLAVFDLSFISLKLVLAPILPFLKKNGRLLLLVKPQFEVGREKVGKGGIVRDEQLRKQAVEGVSEYARSLGLRVLGLSQSCLPGADGNVEYFLLLWREEQSAGTS